MLRDIGFGIWYCCFVMDGYSGYSGGEVQVGAHDE